ncbi:MAG: hypothetical protein ACRC2U_01050 [Aeromonas sp.]
MSLAEKNLETVQDLTDQGGDAYSEGILAVAGINPDKGDGHTVAFEDGSCLVLNNATRTWFASWLD